MHELTNRERIHTNSVASKARHLYSASVLNLDIMDCFFDPQDTNCYQSKHNSLMWTVYRWDQKLNQHQQNKQVISY